MSDLTPIILITVLLLIVAAGIIVFVVIYQKKQLQFITEGKQLKADYEKEILESRLEIQEQTMKTISQEVHDNIGQVLTVAKLHLNIITYNEPGDVLKEKITGVSELLRIAIQDLRDLSKSLHSDIITQKGLAKAIEAEIDILKRTGAYKIMLDINGNIYQLPEQKELIIFRIFQELINNIIKHSKASLINVKIAFQPQLFFLSVSDNGEGFHLSNMDTIKGLGLRNIVNRSQLIGAFYTIDSTPAKGTIIKIELPILPQ